MALGSTLSAAAVSNGFSEQHYTYDALGRRIRKSVTTQQGTTETRFLWQGYRLLQEQQETGGCQTYVYDPVEIWSPLARIDHHAGDKQGEILWFNTDLNGAPLEVTDASGALRWSGQYGSFGKVSRQTEGFSRLGQHPALHHQPLRYAGQYADSETGLHYNLFRYYDPQVGRFTAQDPIGVLGGFNLYQYAPSPNGWVDPLGLSAGDVFIHYTNKAGFENIMTTGVINDNGKEKVYITDVLMSPQDVFRDVLTSNPKYIGSGDYAIIFKLDSVQKTNTTLSSRIEYIHDGNLRLKDIVYSGENPYQKFSDLDYDTRLKMTDNKVNKWGCS